MGDEIWLRCGGAGGHEKKNAVRGGSFGRISPLTLYIIAAGRSLPRRRVCLTRVCGGRGCAGVELPSLHGVELWELKSVCRSFDAPLAFPCRGKNREEGGWGVVTTKTLTRVVKEKHTEVSRK
jgi:hypothetical protein